MKINDGRVTILVDSDGVKIELRDDDASVVFARVKMSPDKFLAALGRLSMVECESMEVFSLDKLGKSMENSYFEFPMPDGIPYKKMKETAIAECEKYIPYGYVPDKGYNSQGSFFDKDGKTFAKTIIRRWV